LTEAGRRGFVGSRSPTILINATDPFAVPGEPPVLACRHYPTEDGVGPFPGQTREEHLAAAPPDPHALRLAPREAGRAQHADK
jgi:hypothetical protein